MSPGRLEGSSHHARCCFNRTPMFSSCHSYYPLDIHSTLGKKENVDDFARVLSRYVDAIAVRVPSSEDVRELASHSSAPVINALDGQIPGMEGEGRLRGGTDPIG